MTFTIKIPKNVADKIRTLPNLNEGSFYYFIGIDGPNELILLTLAPSSLMEEYGRHLNLPWPLSIVGTVCGAGLRKDAMTSLNLGAASLKVLATVDHPSLAVSCMLPDGTVVPETAVDFKVSDDFVQNYSLVRCTMELPFEWTSTTTGTNLRESESLQLWEERILDSNTRLYAPPHSSVVGNVGIRTVQPFHIQRPATDYGTLIDKPSWDAAPSVFVNKSSLTKCFTTLHLDVLAYASIAPNDGMPSMQDTQGLKKSLVEQLRSCINVIESRMEQGYGIPQAIQAYHFLPPGYLHHVTVVYPFAQQAVYVDSTNENDLLDIRKSLHRALGLPMDRPLLRVVQSMNETEFANGKKVHEAGGNRLLNVHQGLSPSGIQGGSVHTIAGSYEYFHYMQDRFDDCGWGCAYRSLQTICSWFQKQRYIGRDPPTHKEIQTTLVKLGDKPAEFVGSRQWIGAIELGFVLETLIGVESKILTVSSGDDMPSKARELCAHFDSQGTPVMIGGGVLAYTLLGVHYNQDTGDCAFLILDPHYTGVDDGSKVRAGQWVAWKRAGEKAAAGGDLFVSGAFYNILCPQRPVTGGWPDDHSTTVKFRDGLERVEIPETGTLGELKCAIRDKLGIPGDDISLSQDPKLLTTQNIDTEHTELMGKDSVPLRTLGISHGSVVYLLYHINREVSPAVKYSDFEKRPFGSHMTVEAMVAAQTRIERQEKPTCSSVSFDAYAANTFQSYIQSALAFSIKRGGLLYGTCNEESGEVQVHAIYEPPQHGTPDQLELERGLEEERNADMIAAGLGWKKVGWIFNGSTKERDFIFSAEEVCQMASIQDEMGEHAITGVAALFPPEDAADDSVSSSNAVPEVHLEAFQVSAQCVKLWKEGWFQLDATAPPSNMITVRNPKDPHDKTPVIVSRKDVGEVDVDYFLVPVGIKDHKSPLHHGFPIENRLLPQGQAELRIHLQRLGRSERERSDGKKYTDLISDFHLLLFLSRQHGFGASDVLALVNCVRNGEPIPDGYRVLIDSSAGL